MAKTQILVVEDEIYVGEYIQIKLQNLGYDVCAVVSSGEEAIKKAEENTPDLVLMDIILKGEMDGIETASQIHSRFNVPVMYLTAYADDEMLERAKITEPYGYILKPFGDGELRTGIEIALYKHEMQKKLKETEEWLSTTLNSIGDAVIATDTEGYVKFMNPVAQYLTGWKQENAVGKSLKNVFNIVSEKTGEQAESPVTRVMKEGVIVGLANHTLFIAKDGTKFPIADSGAPIKDDKGNIIGVVLVFRDLTRYRKMEQELQEARRLESLGVLAGGVAHEISTPTQYVADNTRFIQESFTDISNLLEKYHGLLEATRAGTVSPELVDEIEDTLDEADIEFLSEEIPLALQQSLEGIDRVATIVRAMKEFGRVIEEKMSIDINKAIENTITVARSEWKYVAEMKTDFDTDLPLVLCSPSEINQVILNVLINAAHAIANVVGDGSEGKGTITISTHHDGDWAEIRISDTGTGIPEEIGANIFDPLFTTKEVGKGTCQGLAISYNVVVEKHGGKISFETEIGKGTTFIIRLPIGSESND